MHCEEILEEINSKTSKRPSSTVNQEELRSRKSTMECIRHDQDDAIQFFNGTFFNVAVDHVPLLTKREA